MLTRLVSFLFVFWVECCSTLCCVTDLGYFSHVTRDHPFQDGGLYYRFAEDAKSGGVAADATGQKVGTTNAQSTHVSKAQAHQMSKEHSSQQQGGKNSKSRT